jgi:hypothetical protein
MATTVTDAAIPASITIDGERALDAYVKLLRAEKLIHDHDDPGDGSEALDHALYDLLSEMFGPMFRECEYGLPDGCVGNLANGGCSACDGTESDSSTPLYPLAVERAKSVGVAA